MCEMIILKIPYDKRLCLCQFCEDISCLDIGPKMIATCQDDHQYLASNLWWKKLGPARSERHRY